MPAAAPAATSAPAEEAGATEEMTDVPEAEADATEEMAGTPTAAASEEMTSTEAMTETEGMTPTEEITSTEQMTTAGTMMSATAQLQNAAGEIVGTARLTETQPGVVAIHVEVSGLEVAEAGAHGIHIHHTGQCTPDFQAAGGHFNPTNAQHGLENSQGPHAGDLPVMEINAEGNGTYEATNDRITLGAGEHSLFDDDGSALVIHAERDDQVTDPSGDSGDRIACGVITQGP
jgi:Cu-Zn family superoxide dismutase